jgi:hypothetical protein
MTRLTDSLSYSDLLTNETRSSPASLLLSSRESADLNFPWLDGLDGRSPGRFRLIPTASLARNVRHDVELNCIYLTPWPEPSDADLLPFGPSSRRPSLTLKPPIELSLI